MEQSIPDKISNKIIELAGPSSQYKCALFVRKAIQFALNEADQPTGIESAYNFGPWLIKRQFISLGQQDSDYKTGDVCIMENSEKHIHGHIQIYCSDGIWRSDFVQKGFNPYIDGSNPNYLIYRYEEKL